MKSLTYNGRTYYYYPDDVTIGEYTGQRNVYAQDEDGNEYNIVWGDDGQIVAVHEL